MADLAALLDREATAEIEGILSEARNRASEIVAKAQEEADSLIATRKRTAETQYGAELIRARSAAQLEASSLTLRSQHSAIQQVFEEVERGLEEITRKPAYADVLAALLEEAVRSGGIDPAGISAIMVNPDDQEVAARAAAKAGLNATIVPETGLRGGVRVKAGNNVIIENTLFGRLAALRDELAAEVAQILLSKEG